MIQPFNHLSNRKLKKFEALLYQDISSFDECKLFDYVYDNMRKDFKTYSAFKNHLILLSNQQNLAKDFYTMAWNFKTAAREAAEYMISGEDIGKLDIVFFSVAYMYRQSLELILKAFAFQTITAKQEQMQFIKEVSHDLITIYEKVERNVNTVDAGALGWLKEFLFNVSQVDRASDAFRYPFRIKKCYITGQYEFDYVFKERKDICLKKLINKFEIAFSLIDELYKLGDSNEVSKHKLNLSDRCKDYSSEFLEEGGDYYAKSVIGHDYNKSEIFVYVQAYTKSADYLYNKALEAEQSADKGLSNAFYYPICYLYRNAIELALKGLCLVSCSRRDAVEIIGGNKHNLKKIWKQIKGKYYSNLLIQIPMHIQCEIDKVIEIIDLEDQTSAKFRYPINKHFKYFYPEETKLHVAYDYYYLKQCLSFIDDLYFKTREAIENRYSY